jgi:hypothetical protein
LLWADKNLLANAPVEEAVTTIRSQLSRHPRTSTASGGQAEAAPVCVSCARPAACVL